MMNNSRMTLRSSKTAKQRNPWATLFFAIGALHIYGIITKSDKKTPDSHIFPSFFPNNGTRTYPSHSGAMMSRYLTIALVSAFIAGILELCVYSTL